MAQAMKYCRNCGKQIPADAKFCRYCGYRIAAPAAKSAPAEPAPLQAAPAAPAGGSEERLAAADRAGEMGLELDAPEASAQERAAGVSAPLAALAAALGRFLGGIISALKKPKTLILLVLLVAVWIALALLRGSDSSAVKVLSWLTFARGGQGRSLAGKLGGLLGRGTVAAALASLFTGGLGNTLKGLVAAVKGGGEKRGMLLLTLGTAAGAGLYLVFAGVKTASGATAMAGVAGVLLALQALGKKGGGLYDLALGLTSRAKNGVRAARRGKAESLLTGLALGFAAAAAVAAAL